MTWEPRFTITPAIASDLMAIEAANVVVTRLPLPPAVAAELRERARLRSTHFSTRIEGNRLTLLETEHAVQGQDIRGRERDVGEVRNYWNALLRVETWAAERAPITEALIRQLHALVEVGKRAKPTPYRTQQNVIREAASGAMVYLPPEASDVPGLMAALVAWVRNAERQGLPVPLIAGLLHYQFVTIHPYFDGNGRTARLLATLVLQRGGYGMNGYFSLEEHHARDLEGYYRSLAAHPHHNYYEGRADADLTPWLAYFTRLVATVFKQASEEVQRLVTRPPSTPPTLLRGLDARAKRALTLFVSRDRITAADVAGLLGLSPRTVRDLMAEWVQEGLLVVANTSNRRRSYELSAAYRRLMDDLSAE